MNKLFEDLLNSYPIEIIFIKPQNQLTNKMIKHRFRIKINHLNNTPCFQTTTTHINQTFLNPTSPTQI